MTFAKTIVVRTGNPFSCTKNIDGAWFILSNGYHVKLMIKVWQERAHTLL